MKRFVLGAAILALAAAAGQCAEQSIDVSAGKESVTVRRGQGKVLEYRFAPSPKKPYLKELFTPGGVQVLRDAPADHLHHHGAMFAVAAEGVDFWAETPKSGVERHRALGKVESSQVDGRSQATIRQSLDWVRPDGEQPLLGEERVLRAHLAADEPATLVTWHTRLAPPEGQESIALTGSHYFGLGLRFVESMDQDGAFFGADETDREHVRGTEYLTRTKWMAYASKADGREVTVAVFDHPKNPRRPARMFHMTKPFAYLGATLNLWKEPLTLKPGDALDVRYGIAACDGKASAAQIESLYQRWLALEP